MTSFTRRAVLGGLAASLMVRPALAGESDPRELNLYNAHTGERFRTAYHNGEGYLVGAWKELNWFFRDHYTDTATEMDPRVFDLLWRLHGEYQTAHDKAVTINIHSAFRTKETNDRLRPEGAAPNSFHLYGRAVDISVEGFGIQFLAELVKSIGAGGIGTYWRSQFVHIDTGPRRAWFQSLEPRPTVVRGNVGTYCQKSPCSG